MILLIVLFAILVAALVFVVWQWAHPGQPEEVTWAAQHGVTLTATTGPWVRTYLRTGRNLREVCTIGGLVIPPAIHSATGIDLHVQGLVWMLTGYLIGCLWSELALTRLPDPHLRAASLSTRQVRDYLSTRLWQAQAVFPIVSLALGAVCLTVGDLRADPPIVTSGAMELTDASLRRGALVGAVAGPAVLAVVWMLQRYLVARPQPIVEPSLLEVDDAMRSSSAHLLSATGLTITLLLWSSQLAYLVDAYRGPLRALCAVAMVGCLPAAYLTFRQGRTASWQVRRSTPPPGLSPSTDAPAPTWRLRRSPVAVAVTLVVLLCLGGWRLRSWGAINPSVTIYSSGSVDTHQRVTPAVVGLQNGADAPIEVLDVTIDHAPGTSGGDLPAVSFVNGTVQRNGGSGGAATTTGPSSLPLRVPGHASANLNLLLDMTCDESARAFDPFVARVRIRTLSGRTTTVTDRWGGGMRTECVAALPTGQQPADAPGARSQVEAAFRTVYDWKVPGDQRNALIDDATGIPEAGAMAATGQYADLVTSTTLTVDDVSFDRPDHAWVAYELSSVGTLRTGEARLVGGTWKVTRATVCADLALASVTCPAPPG